MKNNRAKRLLLQGEVAVGTLVFEFNTAGISRIVSEAGADFVLFDMEHTGWDVETIRNLIATSQSSDLATIVRVPTTQYHFIARALDVGAMGVMIPMVETKDQAQLIVQCSKYPPIGRRGAAFGVAHDNYQDGDIVAKMQSANQELLIIALVETVKGVENVDQIAATEGIDVLWIGHFDLTNSMGIPGQFTHPNFQNAVNRVLKACQTYGKPAGFMASSVEEGRSQIKKGFRCLAYSGDIWIYKQALSQGISSIRRDLT